MTPRLGTLLALLLLLWLPASASALPGDAPFAPLSPSDGAVLPVNPDGIPVTYTCPSTGSPTRGSRCSAARRTTA